MEYVNLMASVVTCVTFVAAVASWNINRYRNMDGLLTVGKVPWKGPYTKIRIQNVGGCGVVVQAVWLRHDSYIINEGNDEPRNVLMPGEYFHVYFTDDRDMVVLYTTYNNVKIRHIDRFKTDSLGVVSSRITEYVKPGWRIRRNMKYKEGELFTESHDIAPQRRTIKETNRHKWSDALDNAITWLDDHGYRAIRAGIC